MPERRNATPLPRALVAADRSRHLLDRPFPSDELRTDAGTIDLGSFPIAGRLAAAPFQRGWLEQVRRSARGFSSLGAIHFRFDGALDIATHSESRDADAIRVVSLDSGERMRVSLRFVARANRDPYLRDGTLVIAPDESQPLRAGQRYVALVSRAVAERPAAASGFRMPPEAPPDAAIATVFTVQDSASELRALGRATNAALDAHPEWLQPLQPLRRVERLWYTPDRSARGRRATREVVRFADGGLAETWLGGSRGNRPQCIELRSGPYDVFETAIRVPLFQDPAGEPYQSTGFGVLGDWRRRDGEIAFPNGVAQALPAAAAMRVLVQVPRGRTRSSILLWGHGSGGDAYEAVNKVSGQDRVLAVRETLAAAGVAIVSYDLPHFGRRFPLVARGYSTDQGFVNVPNLVAMRDSPRQAAAEQLAIVRFVREVLPGLVGGDALDASRIGAFGHSTGSQVAVLAAVLAGDAAPRAMLLSAGGGFLSSYASDAALAAIGPLASRDVLALLFGIPWAARSRLDRHHPAFIPYQLLVEGADPLAVARDVAAPLWVIAGRGDRRVPADASRWLAEAAPRGRLIGCVPTADYDGHYCALREPAALAIFRDFAATLRER
jgi:pimeloyl-ACP methyl ester carboxylesterase